MDLSVAIMAHPTRREWVRELRREIGDVPVAWDRKRNVWDTRRRCMLLRDPTADFHLMIQDDGVLGRDFFPRLYRILEEHGDRYVYCLYFRIKRRNPAFAEAGEAGLPLGGFAYPRLQFGVGIVVPVPIIDPLLEWCTTSDYARELDKPAPGREKFGDGRHDDLRISGYLDSIGMLTYYPLPSLVNHRREGTSLVGNGRNIGRMATWFE